MEYVRGTKVTALNPVALIDVDPEGLADELIQAYLHQILIDGFFHADPHPGNVFITEDGRLALIDLGMVGHLSPTLQEKLLKLILAISEGRGEEAAMRRSRSARSVTDFDEDAFKRDVRRHRRPLLRRVAGGVSGRQDRARSEPVRGRARHQVAGRAHDAGKDAAEPRQHRADARARARRQRVDHGGMRRA